LNTEVDIPPDEEEANQAAEMNEIPSATIEHTRIGMLE
jgi:hypothetical protein